MTHSLRVRVMAGSSARRASLEELVRASWKREAVTVVTGAAFGPRSETADGEILLTDLHTPAFASEFVRHLAGTADAAAIALIDDPEPRWVRAALNAGVSAILGRDALAGDLRLALQAALAGLVLLHPSSARELAAGTVLPLAMEAEPEHLTPREREVLRLISDGLGNKEIAARLGISDHTVKFHTSSILGKLGASTRTEAVSQGIRKGLIAI